MITQNKSGPKAASVATLMRLTARLQARFAFAIHRDGRSGRCAHLHVMLLTTEEVRHVVVSRLLVRHVAAMLHVLGAHHVVVARASGDVGTRDGTADRARGRCNILPAS